MPGTREMTGITLHVFSDGYISGMNTRKHWLLHRNTDIWNIVLLYYYELNHL